MASGAELEYGLSTFGNKAKYTCKPGKKLDLLYFSNEFITECQVNLHEFLLTTMRNFDAELPTGIYNCGL